MATITATMVKDLRDKTGAGMMDCKAALAETKGDIEAAVDWLRTKGLAKAAKKAGRVAAEGLIGLAADAQTGGAGRGQFRNGFRGPQPGVPEHGVGHRRGRASGQGRSRQACQGQVSGRQRHRCRHHQGDDRLDRREHDAPPHRAISPPRTARSRATCTTRWRRGSARSASSSRSSRRATRMTSKPSAARSPCISLSPIRKASMSTASTRPSSSASARC